MGISNAEFKKISSQIDKSKDKLQESLATLSNLFLLLADLENENVKNSPLQRRLNIEKSSINDMMKQQKQYHIELEQLKETLAKMQPMS